MCSIFFKFLRSTNIIVYKILQLKSKTTFTKLEVDSLESINLVKWEERSYAKKKDHNH